ncbi:MAG TPA: ribosome biogenesis GTP-binding protein YihA/YsxC [Candidatus Polarisedimenticolia bacterium]|nr:ribosome biogenesis GTP-binding protein YihA/YsxC [Candidatus Polarisedimenticolia bacterium]
MKITACRFHVSATRPEEFPRDDRPQIAFMGRSNVGKSSLLNRLLGVRGLARSSKEPGRTRAINFFLVNERVYFVDLPGYGYARVPDAVREQWRGMVEEYVVGPGRPDLALQLLDVRREASDMDGELREWLADRGVRHAIVLTKLDKLSGNERTRALAGAARWIGLKDGSRPVAVSATTGEGLAALWRVIDDVCENTASRAARGDGPRARAATQGGSITP